jgi:hypothetical protein
MADPVQRRRIRWWAAAILTLAAATVLARLSVWSRPLPADAGAYLYIGQVMLHGGVPYVDAIDNKGPVTYLLFMVVRAIAGTSGPAVSATLLVFALLAGLAVAGYAARLAGRAAGIAAALVFAFVGSAPWHGSLANTEEYAVAPMAAAWWLATRSGARSAAAAGALAGVAMLMNVGFVLVAIPVAFELWRAADPGGRGRRFLAAAGGALVVAVAVLGWLALQGALGPMLHQTIGYGADAMGSTLHVPPSLARRVDLPNEALLLVGVLGVALGLGDPRLRRAATGAAVWMATMLLRAKLAPYDGEPFSHHYYLLTPGLAVALAVGAAAVLGRFRGRLPRVAVAAAGTWLLLVYVVAPNVRSLGHPDPGTDEALARVIRDRTRPQDRILVSGYAPQIYWLSDRRAASPVFAVPLFGAVSRDTNYPRVYRELRLRQTLERPPAAIAGVRGHENWDVRAALRLLPYRLAYRRCAVGDEHRRYCDDVWTLPVSRPSTIWAPRCIPRVMGYLSATGWDLEELSDLRASELSRRVCVARPMAAFRPGHV